MTDGHNRLAVSPLTDRRPAWLPSPTATALWGIGFVLIVSTLNLLWSFVLMPLQVSLMSNEGWNALHSVQAVAGDTLYPANDAYMFNNYPPLSYYIVGALGSVIGDNIFAGRIISLLAVFVIAANVTQTVRNLGGTAAFGIFSGALWIGILSKSYLLYVGVNDPQLLAHAVMTTGFTIFTASPRQTRYVAAAAFVMVVAGFIKHNQFAMPLAVTTWLLQHDRRILTRWIAFSLIFLALGFAICGIVYGTAFFAQLLTPRTYDFYNVIILLGWIQGFAIPLGLWIAFALLAPPQPQFRLISHLLVAGGVVFVITRTGNGVSINSLLDWVIGASIATGVMLSYLGISRLSHRHGVTATCAVIVAILCLRMIILPANTLIRFLSDPSIVVKFREHEAAYRNDITFMRRQTGPTICEDLALCYWSGHTSIYDAFNADQAFLTGARDLEALKRNVVAGQYKLLQLFADSQLLEAARASGLKESYGNADGHIFFTPKEGP